MYDVCHVPASVLVCVTVYVCTSCVYHVHWDCVVCVSVCLSLLYGFYMASGYLYKVCVLPCSL